MGIITAGVISKVLDIAGNVLDPGKKKELEIALKEKEIELEKIIIENDTQKEIARQKTLSTLFEKGGFPALIWLFGLYGVADIILQICGRPPIEMNSDLTYFLGTAFLAVMGKQGYIKVKGADKWEKYYKYYR